MTTYLKQKSNALVQYLGERKEARHFDQDPIVIGGCGRSGTTLLLSILSSHPEIYAIPHESVALVNWEHNTQKKGASGFSLYPSRLDRLYRHLLVNRIPAEARRWCEKTPRNIHHLENILGYWPDAFFLNIIRDPRDVLTSKHQNKPGEYWVSLDRWVRDVNKGLEYQDHPRVITIRYEDLVQNFEPTIKNLCVFLKITCAPEIQNWHAHTTVRKNRAWQGKVVKLHTKSLAKWKQQEHESRLAEIMGDQRIAELMKRLNYT